MLFDPDNDILEGPGLESTLTFLTLLERYVIEAGGWDKLPAEWRETPTPRDCIPHLSEPASMTLTSPSKSSCMTEFNNI